MTPDSNDTPRGRPQRILRRRRDLGGRAAWNSGDLAIAGSLLGLLPAAWLLPERCWRGLTRILARLPLVDRGSLDRTAQAIGRGRAGTSADRALKIALDLQAAVYELRLQNLRAWRPGGWQPRVTFSGLTHLDAARAAGRGAILWVGHFAFNSNVTKIALAARGCALAHMSRPEHGFSKTRLGIALLNPVRCLPEDRHLAERIVFDRRNPVSAMRRMVETLRHNGLLSITAGAWEGSDLIAGTLLDGRMKIALGAPRLAALTGAALLPVFTVREADGSFHVAIEAPLALPPGLGRRDAECAAAQAYLARHEPWIARYPDQWRGWKEWQAG
ncbi:MAG TPA: hypothetical protein PLR41_01810 [Alphaproteobacteria bacterium]|nr:hypothetical protein [Alphaproteobacteria bacterium]